MFERFTKDARVAVVLAQEEARMLRHRSIGTEHLLIGLAGHGDDPAARALRERGVTAADLRHRVRASTGDSLDPAALATVGIDLDTVRRATEERFGAGALDPAPSGRLPKGHIPFDAGAKKALELALRAAVSLRSGSLSTGHLLLGIVDEGQSLGVRVLTDSGIDVALLRAETVTLIGSAAA